MRAAALVVLAACNYAPFALRFTLTDGDAQRCVGDTGTETTNPADITIPCNGVLSVRIVPPKEEAIPYVSLCTPLLAAPDGATPHKLSSIASIDLPRPEKPVPEQLLEVQMAVFALDDLTNNGYVDANNDPICPQVNFAANNLAVAAVEPCTGSDCVPEPAYAGRTFYHPGDPETIVKLGCVAPEVIASCKKTTSTTVDANVNDFETTVSVSSTTADVLTVSIGEPTPDGSGAYKLTGAPMLGRVIPDPPGGPTWSSRVENLAFVNSLCLQVFEDISSSTTTVHCARATDVANTASAISLVGYRLPRATLAQIVAAAGEPSFPPEGLVIGIVLNEFFLPVQGAVVTVDTGTVKYLSADRSTVTTTSTSSNGIFISKDAPFNSTFTWGEEQAIGGLIDDKVTIVVLQQTIQTN